MNIEKIKLGFENVEFAEIPKEFIIAIGFSGVKKNIVGGNLITKYNEDESCESCRFELLSTAANIETAYTMDLPLFKRIQRFQDIIDIELFYDDGTSRIISVPWKGTCEINDYQTCALRNNGNLLVVVDPNDKAENYH